LPFKFQHNFFGKEADKQLLDDVMGFLFEKMLILELLKTG